MHWYFDVLKKYASFSGRARRMEYWMFTLFSILIMLILLILLIVFTIKEGSSITSNLLLITLLVYFFATLLPSIALTVRRLHDSNRSGAFIFLYFFPYIGGLGVLVLLCLNGTPGANLYDEDPLNYQLK